jgi:CubicO group peptidase (beta-lactamase class C family)
MFMFGRILTRICNETLHGFLSKRVTDYIGMGRWSWPIRGKVNGIDVNWGCGCASLSALQLARWGQLFLNRGNWNGRQLISASWIDEISHNQVPTSIGLVVQRDRQVDGRGVYSYNWWLNGNGPDGSRKIPDAPNHTYWASGYNNNMCFIIPDWSMVVVRMGTSGIPIDSDKTWNGFFRRLGDAVR